MCARVNSLPRTTTPFLFFCFFFFCSYLMSPFFPLNTVSLFPAGCAPAAEAVQRPHPFSLFFFILYHQASFLQLFFFLTFQGHVFISVSSKFSRHAGGVRRCRSDWHTHTLGCRNAHNGHAHTRTHFFHSYTNDSTRLSRQMHTRDTTRETGSPAGQPAF